MIEQKEVEKFLTILELQYLAMLNPFRRSYIKGVITSIRRELDWLESKNASLEGLKTYVDDTLCFRIEKENGAMWKVRWGRQVLSYLCLLDTSESEELETEGKWNPCVNERQPEQEADVSGFCRGRQHQAAARSEIGNALRVSVSFDVQRTKKPKKEGRKHENKRETDYCITIVPDCAAVVCHGLCRRGRCGLCAAAEGKNRGNAADL